jgi:YozE SAM-like protein
MAHCDPWEKAADCERGLAVADPKRRPILEQLRDLWIALGNEQSLMSDAQLAKEVEAIGRIQADMVPECPKPPH